MKYYDFIEIGTSNFSTLIEEAGENTKGISVEPIKYYLDQLPNKPYIHKVNCAISFDNNEQEIKIFYIPEKIIEEQNLPWWVKGCNSINDYHHIHKKYNLLDMVVVETVKSIPISKLFLDYDVGKIELLKIDTEGGDSDIMLNLLPLLKQRPISQYPTKIIFEANFLTSEEKITKVINNYQYIGYKIKHRDIDNVILSL